MAERRDGEETGDRKLVSEKKSMMLKMTNLGQVVSNLKVGVPNRGKACCLALLLFFANSENMPLGPDHANLLCWLGLQQLLHAFSTPLFSQGQALNALPATQAPCPHRTQAVPAPLLHPLCPLVWVQLERYHLGEEGSRTPSPPSYDIYHLILQLNCYSMARTTSS